MTSGDDYRKRAGVVGQKLGRGGNRGTRAMLKNKRSGLLEQAANQDWLDGKAVPPAMATNTVSPKSRNVLKKDRSPGH
jgi:hypothetical protein